MKGCRLGLRARICPVQYFSRQTVSSSSTKLYAGSQQQQQHNQMLLSPSSFDTKFAQIIDVDGVSRSIHYVDMGPTNSNVAKDNSNTNSNEQQQQQQQQQKPIIIVGGTAQTISTYAQHIKQLSKSRRVLMPELRCQGTLTELDPIHGNIDRHCLDFVQFLHAVNITTSIDFLGFSFGGRVGITLAALYPDLISKLSVTGVPLIRPTLGEEILTEWREHLAQGRHYACGESFLRNGYSEEFLVKNAAKLDTFIQFVLDSNNMDRVHQLLIQSHPRNDSDLYSLQACAKRVKCKTQVIAATQDKIAGFESVKDLAECIENSSFAAMSNQGHLAPFENPIVWRKLVTDFLMSS